MNYNPTRILILTFLLAVLLAACDNSPSVMVTLAATAAPPSLNSSTPAATEDKAPATATTAAAAPEKSASETTPVEVAPTAELTPTTAPSPTPAATTTPPPLTYTYEIINTYPHDPTAFTQGMVYYDGSLYEGTGRWGESSLREVALETGSVLRSHPLESQYFGEGIALLNDKIFQLTWQEQTGFVYDRATFEPLQTFNYPTEGWGITHDGQRLIVSDGTSTIYFWDPETIQETGRITVRDNNGPVNRLNELEYVNGEIWANIWLTDLIARISPETGEVLGYIDLSGLLETSDLTEPVDVLNGIAFDPETGRIFVTGKLWPSLFEIAVVPAP